MSYILDALKKSEQERGHGSVPGVQTIHSSSLNYQGDKKSYWPYILISAVILNFLAIVYFIVHKNQATVQTTESVLDKSNKVTAPKAETTDKTTVVITENEEIQAPVTAVVTEDNSIQKDTATPLTSRTKLEKPAIGSEEVESISSPAVDSSTESARNIIEFYDLPETIQQQLPTIIISAHVYSDNPLQRSIVINNNFLEEGEYILDDLILYEITPDGAVFDFKDTRFHYGIVNTWQ